MEETKGEDEAIDALQDISIIEPFLEDDDHYGLLIDEERKSPRIALDDPRQLVVLKQMKGETRTTRRQSVNPPYGQSRRNLGS